MGGVLGGGGSGGSGSGSGVSSGVSSSATFATPVAILTKPKTSPPPHHPPNYTSHHSPCQTLKFGPPHTIPNSTTTAQLPGTLFGNYINQRSMTIRTQHVSYNGKKPDISYTDVSYKNENGHFVPKLNQNEVKKSLNELNHIVRVRLNLCPLVYQMSNFIFERNVGFYFCAKRIVCDTSCVRIVVLRLIMYVNHNHRFASFNHW